MEKKLELKQVACFEAIKKAVQAKLPGVLVSTTSEGSLVFRLSTEGKPDAEVFLSTKQEGTGEQIGDYTLIMDGDDPSMIEQTDDMLVDVVRRVVKEKIY